MPNHDVRIEDADVWDILDWDTVTNLIAPATDPPADAEQALPYMAKRLIDAASKPIGRDDEVVLRRIVSGWVPHRYGGRTDAVRRQAASILAEKLGARPDRFIEYAAYKWGLFKRR